MIDSGAPDTRNNSSSPDSKTKYVKYNKKYNMNVNKMQCHWVFYWYGLYQHICDSPRMLINNLT